MDSYFTVRMVIPGHDSIDSPIRYSSIEKAIQVLEEMEYIADKNGFGVVFSLVSHTLQWKEDTEEEDIIPPDLPDYKPEEPNPYAMIWEN